MMTLGIKVEVLIENIYEHLNSSTSESLRIVERALSRCSISGHVWNGFEGEIARLFGISMVQGARAIPAAILASSELPGPIPTGIMRAEPVHLRADPTRVVLIEGSRLGIQDKEAEGILGTLNEAFSDENITFRRGGDKHRWYVEGAPQAPPGERSPSDLSGARLEPSLAEMRDAGTLKRITTEIQMILHEHEINQVRTEKGVPELNSIWFFGAGEPLENSLPAVEKVLTNSTIALSSAKFSDIKSSAVSVDSDLFDLLLDGDARTSAIICAAPGAEKLQVSRDSFAVKVLVRLSQLLEKGDISSFKVCSEMGTWSIKRRDRWCFWRKSLSLTEYS